MPFYEINNQFGYIKVIDKKEMKKSTEYDKNICYRLLSVELDEAVFLISVKTDEESAVAFAGTDEAVAREIFVSLASGTVTPCTVKDVCRDLLIEK